MWPWPPLHTVFHNEGHHLVVCRIMAVHSILAFLWFLVTWRVGTRVLVYWDWGRMGIGGWVTVLRPLGNSPVQGDCWWGVKKKVSSGLAPLLEHFLRALSVTISDLAIFNFSFYYTTWLLRCHLHGWHLSTYDSSRWQSHDSTCFLLIGPHHYS